METIIITILLISVLYLIFAVRELKSDVSDVEFRMNILKDICADYEKRIKELEFGKAREANRRTSADSYRRICQDAISKCAAYCNNGWSVSKTLFTKAQGKAYRLFERSIRPAYIRAKREVQRLVYRTQKGQEVLSLQRAERVYTERFK